MKFIHLLMLMVIVGTVGTKPVDEENTDSTAQGGDDKKDKVADVSDAAASNSDSVVTPSDIPAGDSTPDAESLEKKSDIDNADAKPNPDPTPTTKPDGTKPSTSKPTVGDKADKVPDASPTSVPSTNKPATSPSPTSTSHHQSTVQPTIVKKASVPTTPKPTSLATTAATTPKAKSTAASTDPTTIASTHRPTKPPTTKAPPAPPSDADARSKVSHVDKYGQTVEKSDNNTMRMNGTTFRIAVRLLDAKFTEDLNYQKNPVFQRLKKNVMSAVAVVYDGYHDFKQIAIIGFTETPMNDSDADKRDEIGGGGNAVIADFYLRFFSYGRHLKKLTDAIKSEKLGTLSVSPKFVKAYTAEPKGRVCTPDCRLKCYSYCDDGCCSLNLIPRVDPSTFVESPRLDLQWSTAPIAPHSQPLEEAVCRGLACLTRSPIKRKPAMLPLTVVSQQSSLLAPHPPPQQRTDGCIGAQCMHLGLPLGEAMFNQPPQSIKQCNGDKRCEAKLVRRVAILKAVTPYGMDSSDIGSPASVSGSQLDRTTSLMENTPLSLISQNPANAQARSGIEPLCVDPDKPICMNSNIAEPEGQNGQSALQQKMNIIQGVNMRAPSLQSACPSLCIQNCLPSCPSTCCYTQAAQSSSMFLD